MTRVPMHGKSMDFFYMIEASGMKELKNQVNNLEMYLGPCQT